MYWFKYRYSLYLMSQLKTWWFQPCSFLPQQTRVSQMSWSCTFVNYKVRGPHLIHYYLSSAEFFFREIILTLKGRKVYKNIFLSLTRFRSETPFKYFAWDTPFSVERVTWSSKEVLEWRVSAKKSSTVSCPKAFFPWIEGFSARNPFVETLQFFLSGNT